MGAYIRWYRDVHVAIRGVRTDIVVRILLYQDTVTLGVIMGIIAMEGYSYGCSMTILVIAGEYPGLAALCVASPPHHTVSSDYITNPMIREDSLYRDIKTLDSCLQQIGTN